MSRFTERTGRVRRWVAALAAGGVCVAVGIATNALTAVGGPPTSGPARVGGPIQAFPGAYVRGAGLYRSAGSGREALGQSVSSPLAGSLSPVASSSPDGRYIAYDVWRAARAVDRKLGFAAQGIADGDRLGTPSIRLYDTTSGKDSVLQDGAYSHAWRADGAVAFVRGVKPDLEAEGGYPGIIVVRDPAGKAELWTPEAARYVAYGWAGRHLVAYRIGLGEELETVVLDGPGALRSLGAGSVVAISPDGTRLLMVNGDALRLVDVASGSEIVAGRSRRSARSVYRSRPCLPVVLGLVARRPGGRRRVVRSRGPPGDGDRISVEQVLQLDPAQFPIIEEPQLSDDGNRIIAVAEIPPTGSTAATNFLVSCDRATRACERGDPAPATDWTRPVRHDAPNGEGREVMTRIAVLLAAVAVAAATALPAGATSPSYFDFARKTNLSSVLTFYWESLPGHESSLTWRAGSGSGSTDECATGRGWLPAGWYDLKGHWDNYDGSKIKGRAWLLQNKQCWNGTWRTELFIHSEETASNGQSCPTAGDDPFCWEGDSDYASAGCIKVSRAGNPSNLALVHTNWHQRSGDQRHGSFTIARWLYVH